MGCNQKNDCCPFRKIIIPAVMGDDSEDSPSAPENGAYRNALVEYEANGAMYIYASDGIWTKLSLSAGEYGAATIAYVDSQDTATLQTAKDYADTKDRDVLDEAKDYTDARIPQTGVSQQYVDSQDTITLNAAKSYADAQDVTTLNSAKAYADAQDATTLTAANSAASSAINTAIASANIPVFTMSTSDIGEDAPLAANTFYGVYQ